MIFDDRYSRLRFLVETLLAESNQTLSDDVCEDMLSQMFRALRNIREAKPISESFIKAQDEELQWQLEKKGIVALDDIPGEKIRVWQGDITRLGVDAIVNAANKWMLGCFAPLHACIDNAIHSAAGVQLREECAGIMAEQGHLEETGTAKITKAYNLPSRYVIHTVGPIISHADPIQLEVQSEQKEQLASCYRSCLELAEKKGLKSIAFCCISTGEFHFPNDLAAEIAVRTVEKYNSNITVVFNVYKDIDKEAYRKLLPNV